MRIPRIQIRITTNTDPHLRNCVAIPIFFRIYCTPSSPTPHLGKILVSRSFHSGFGVIFCLIKWQITARPADFTVSSSNLPRRIMGRILHIKLHFQSCAVLPFFFLFKPGVPEPPEAAVFGWSRSRYFWSGSCSYSTVNILFLRDPKVMLTLIVFRFF